MSSVTRSAGAVSSTADSLCVDTPVAVLNTHYSGLGIARNLGQLGIRVFGLTAYREFPGNRSRWIEYRPSPDSQADPERLVDFLARLADEVGERIILLPTRDHDIQFINRNRGVLETRYTIPFAMPEVIDRAMNKDRLFLAAVQAGIAVPRSVTFETTSDTSRARQLRFPCVCKPPYASQWRRPGIWEAVGRQKAVKVSTYEELERFYARFSAIDPVVMVQEWIAGGESNLQIFGSYCDADHEVQAFFTARKQLQYPALMGTGIAVEALPIPGIEAPSRTLLRKLAFHGVSEIEFKVDDRDGGLYLIEINPRHWDQHRLGTSVGVNLTEALYRDATGQAQRRMLQTNDHVMWIAERELGRHFLRCGLGLAPRRDIFVGMGMRWSWALFDRDDLGPLFKMIGSLPRFR